jgi:hypothetical protein
MKPDKHKKKNSEQYMKKHNGSGADESAIREVHVKHKQDRTAALSGKGQRIESTITEPHHSASSGFQKPENFVSISLIVHSGPTSCSSIQPWSYH